MSERHVVITGMGLISSLGKNLNENWDNVLNSKTGIAHNPKEDLPYFFQYMGKVKDYDLPHDIPPKQMGQIKFLNRGAVLGFCSSYEAIASSPDAVSDIAPGRRALYAAAGDFTKVGYDFMYPAIKDASDTYWEDINHEKLNESALNKVNPFFLLESLNNNLFSFLSAFIEFMGPNTSLASLSPCGGNALELAYRSIKQDKADIALAVGYGSWITEIPLYELEGLGILSKCKHGIQSYRPFDSHRDGFIPGEGGAAVLLSDYETAKKKNRSILGKIKGVGNSTEFSSYNKISVPLKVSKRCIESVLKEADCNIDDMGLIIPHGSGTRKGDRSELRSIIDIFGKVNHNSPICGLKPYTGHLGAASDIAEVIFGIKALQEKTVPATLNFSETEKEFASLKIASSPQSCKKNRFLSVSYGVGGQSSSVIVELI